MIDEEIKPLTKEEYAKLVAGINSARVWITPEIAVEMLKNNHPYNRRKDKARVNAYASDMKNNIWIPTGQGIEIDVDEYVINGQHLLEAIVLSGTTQSILVTTGSPRQARHVLDTGRRRTFNDTSRLTGSGFGSRHDSIARAMHFGPTYKQHGIWISHQDRTKLIERHKEAIDFVVKLTSGTGIGKFPAASKAALAAVYEYAPVLKDHLTEFMEVYKNPVNQSPRKSAAVAFKRYMTDPSRMHMLHQHHFAQELYHTTERAIEAFICERTITLIKPPRDAKTGEYLTLFPVVGGEYPDKKFLAQKSARTSIDERIHHLKIKGQFMKKRPVVEEGESEIVELTKF